MSKQLAIVRIGEEAQRLDRTRGDVIETGRRDGASPARHHEMISTSCLF